MRAALLAVLVCGCSLDVDHTIGVDVDWLDSDCITLLPVCSAAGYECHDAEGRDYPECKVGCVAGRALVCHADGPHCVQDFVGSEETVPTLCLSRVPEAM